MALGIDTGSPLNRRQDRWEQFLTQLGQQPSYAGRYFGNIQPGVRSANAWVPGELSTLLAASPLAQSIRYIFPFAPPGPFTTTRPANLSQHGLQDSPVFFRQQGETRNGQGRQPKPLEVREHGREDAIATCEQIAAALSFVAPGTSQPELVLPDSEAVFVFLDVEPQTALSPHYWLGWAETVSSFTMTRTTAIGTVVLVQPLRPCLYCVVDQLGPWPEITGAFRDGIHLGTNSRQAPLPCAVDNGMEQANATFSDAINATQVEVDNRWNDLGGFGALTQPLAPEAEVVIWQYRLNIGMTEERRIFEMFTEAEKKTETVFDTPNGKPIPIDLNATRQTHLNGHPITDYMLRRP